MDLFSVELDLKRNLMRGDSWSVGLTRVDGHLYYVITVPLATSSQSNMIHEGRAGEDASRVSPSIQREIVRASTKSKTGESATPLDARASADS
jgi:hypothetical protein